MESEKSAHWVRQKKLAELANVTPSNISYLKRNKKYKSAFKNRLVNLLDENIQEYIQIKNPVSIGLKDILNSKAGSPKTALGSGSGTLEKTQAEFFEEMGGRVDSFNRMCLPEDRNEQIELLKRMTLEEVVKKFGGIAGFKEFTVAQKGMADYEKAVMNLQRERSELIERKYVSGVVMKYFEIIVKKIVYEIPEQTKEKIERYIEVEKKPASKIADEYSRRALRLFDTLKVQIESNL